MIDVHCHMQFHSFENDYEQIITNSFEEGLFAIINTGTKLDSSRKAIELAKRFEKCFAIVGIHPHHADKLELEENWEEQLFKLTKEKKVVGIGEVGLDYYSYQSNGVVDHKLQKDVFEKQIEIAHKANLPLQIHNRHAGEDIMEILRYHKNMLKNPPGMFHCFAASIEVLKQALDMGFSIGFDGNITYKGLAPGETTDLKDIASYTPIDRILTETDSPFLTPVPHRGSRNKPSYVILIGKFLAELKKIPFEELDQKTTQNAQSLFQLKNI